MKVNVRRNSILEVQSEEKIEYRNLKKYLSGEAIIDLQVKDLKDGFEEAHVRIIDILKGIDINAHSCGMNASSDVIEKVTRQLSKQKGKKDDKHSSSHRHGVDSKAEPVYVQSYFAEKALAEKEQTPRYGRVIEKIDAIHDLIEENEKDKERLRILQNYVKELKLNILNLENIIGLNEEYPYETVERDSIIEDPIFISEIDDTNINDMVEVCGILNRISNKDSARLKSLNTNLKQLIYSIAILKADIAARDEQINKFENSHRAQDYISECIQEEAKIAIYKKNN